jgi:hypothetical protein
LEEDGRPQDQGVAQLPRPLQTMRFETGFFPDPMHVVGFLAGGRQNPRAQYPHHHRAPQAGMIGIEPIQPGVEKTLLPANDGPGGGLQPTLDGVERSPFRQQQDQLGAKDVAPQKVLDSGPAKFWSQVETCRFVEHQIGGRAVDS